jgi:hypothetical protein
MYSVTQGTNIAALISVLTLLANKLELNWTMDDITVLVAGVIAISAIITNFINRFKKGDISLAGFKSPMI